MHFDISLLLLTVALRGVSNKHCLLPLFSFVYSDQIVMPPTLKELMGHIAFGASVGACVRHTFCTYCNL